MPDKHTGQPNEDEDEDEAGTVEAVVTSALASTGRLHISSNAITVDEKDIGLKTANPPQPRIQVQVLLRSVPTVARIIITQITVLMIP